MVDRLGLVRVLDLGLALHVNAWRNSLAAAHREEIFRTANYLSPEQVVDSHKVDLRTDIYNLGCTLYFLLTGHSPFAGVSPAQKISAIQKMMPEDVRTYRSDCPRDMVDICTKMLQKNPDLRYQKMREVSETLEKWLFYHGFTFDPGAGDAAVRDTILKKSKIDSMAAQSHPKKSQPATSPQFPAFPLPGGVHLASRLFLSWLVIALLIAATSLAVVWLLGYW